jgi:hypothetical protein
MEALNNFLRSMLPRPIEAAGPEQKVFGMANCASELMGDEGSPKQEAKWRCYTAFPSSFSMTYIRENMLQALIM